MYLCARGIGVPLLYDFVLLDFETVRTVWYFCFTFYCEQRFVGSYRNYRFLSFACGNQSSSSPPPAQEWSLNDSSQSVFPHKTKIDVIAGNTFVSNHCHSVKNVLFSSAKPRDFDGMLGTGLPCQCTQRKLQSISAVLTLSCEKKY